jgi:hypothetical protein
VVDNALVSGRTMELVMSHLQSHGMNLDIVMHLFDREEVDHTGVDTATRVAQEYHCEVVPVFLPRCIDRVENASDRRILLDYTERFGTEALKTYVSRPYVSRLNR